MLETVTVKPNTRTADILFFDELDITGHHVIPLFGPNGVGKSTLIKQLEDRRDITIKTNGMPTKFYSYQNARDNFKIRQPRSYMESFDPGFMSARFSAQSISEGQSIIYSMFDLLDGLKPKQPLAPEPGQDALVLLDEIDSGMSIDNIDITMKKIKNLIQKNEHIQFIFSFNSPRVLKHFPRVLSMYDGTFIELHSDEDMLSEIRKHKSTFDKARKNSRGRPKIID